MKSGSNMTTKNNYIPDIIVDILSKLPSKSVLRFKIVCKTWYSLISDPVFTNLHSKRAPHSPKILFRSTSAFDEFQLFDYKNSSLLDDDCCLSGSIKFPRKKYFYRIVGSSCGLVCVATDGWSGNRFTIWNPLTRECRKLPNLSMMKIYERSHYYFHGLGYDSVANDFKLVISRDRIKYNVFSLKANSWKTITCPDLIDSESDDYNPDAIQPWNSLAIVLNGIFHWIMAPANNNDSEIVAFNVGNETFQKLQLPQHVSWNSDRLASLLEHNGCLCICFLNGWPIREIWMKKEYDGWVHLLTIKNSPPFKCYQLPVSCISTRSEVVFHTDEKFSKCGREEEDKLDEKFCSGPFVYRPVLYIETLVSPFVGLEGKKNKKRKSRMNSFLKSMCVSPCFTQAKLDELQS